MEVIIVVAMAGILLMIAGPSLSRVGTDSRVGNAAVAVAADLDQARGLASRLNVPVRISYDPDAKAYVFTNRVSGAVLVRRTVAGDGSEYELGTFELDPAGNGTTVDVYPNGLASASATITVGAGDYTRTITMTRAGLITVSSP